MPIKFQTAEIASPLAHFITFSSYGTWLHGGKLTSVDRDHNLPGADFLELHQGRHKSEANRLKEDLYILGSKQREIVLKTLIEVCVFRGWSLLAAHVRTNHVHIVVYAIEKPERIMNDFKSYASRRLNESGVELIRERRWTRHGSTRYLWKIEEVEATINYVIHEQGEPMAIFENKERVLNIIE